jgi:hypothetical protein
MSLLEYVLIRCIRRAASRRRELRHDALACKQVRADERTWLRCRLIVPGWLC